MLTVTRNVRIEWGDCDPAGIVYFPRYFEYFDQCTAGMFEAVGYRKPALLQTFDIAGFPLVDARANFRMPSKFGDDVRDSHDAFRSGAARASRCITAS